MTSRINKNRITTLILCFSLHLVACVNIQSGKFSLTLAEEHHQPQVFDVKLNSKSVEEIKLTQSSKLNIKAQLTFSQQTFIPELTTFRLRHSDYENLTEPILAKYNQQESVFVADLDLGDPKQIKPFTSDYKLEVIVADQLLQQNIRQSIANCKITFRKSLEQFEPSQLHYKTEQIIQTSPPQERVDPPKIFTLFVVIIILAVDAVFVFGLKHLKVNVSLLPKSSSGFLLNVGFLVVLMANLAALLKFWINWTFLDTLQCLLILLIPTALIANYAFVHVRKH